MHTPPLRLYQAAPLFKGKDTPSGSKPKTSQDKFERTITKSTETLYCFSGLDTSTVAQLKGLIASATPLHQISEVNLQTLQALQKAFSTLMDQRQKEINNAYIPALKELPDEVLLRIIDSTQSEDPFTSALEPIR